MGHAYARLCAASQVTRVNTVRRPINPKGIFATSGGSGDPSFQARFKAVVQYRGGHDSKWGRKSGRCCCFFRLG